MDNKRKEPPVESRNFQALRISLASPEQILSWSYGEVTKPETINYRRLRPEKDGLFCEAIFGPSKDWRCYCGKYKNPRYKGIVCEKCGVEVTRSSVRRERMGHIELAAPVAHLWYTRRVPSYIAYLLGLTKRNMDRVLYFAQHIITQVDEEARQKALKRLDTECEEQREQLETDNKRQIAEIEQHMAQEETRCDEQLQEIQTQLDEELAAATEGVMKQAQAVQKKVENRQGKKIRVPIVFEPTDDVIAEPGVIVGNEHLKLLSQTVQDHLSELEFEIQTRREEASAPLKADLELFREQTAKDISQIKEQLIVEVAALRARLTVDREELLGLAKLQILNEPQLRELKGKWGQVFKAGIGAEAFYEILCRLDLDKLAKELWHEIRHGTSKQRRKQATKRLRVIEALQKSGNRPEWMILTILPVIPPDLRPWYNLMAGDSLLLT